MKTSENWMVTIKQNAKYFAFTLILFLAVVNTGCGGGGSSGSSSEVLPREEIIFNGIGPNGIFDPALAFDPVTNRIWMSYSEVGDSAMWPGQNTTIDTRLAYSDDAGANWYDANLEINTSIDVTLPLPQPNNAGTWVNEVSSIVHDPGAPAEERWKILSHHYLTINGVTHYEIGWIAMKTAPSPEGPWSTERKLFAGALYDSASYGAPEVQLDQLDPELNFCQIFSEPGMVSTAEALYVVLLGIDPTVGNRIILLKWSYPNPSGEWQYLGSFLLGNLDGPLFGYDAFTAPDMFIKGTTHYLITSPRTGNKYLGTFVFEIEDLDSATLIRTGVVPDLIMELYGSDGSHNGAAGYVAEATASGIIYSEVFITPTPFFRIYASHRNP